MPKSDRILARERRDEAMRKLGEELYRAWIASGRPATANDEPLKAVDAACADVALQA